MKVLQTTYLSHSCPSLTSYRICQCLWSTMDTRAIKMLYYLMCSLTSQCYAAENGEEQRITYESRRCTLTTLGESISVARLPPSSEGQICAFTPTTEDEVL